MGDPNRRTSLWIGGAARLSLYRLVRRREPGREDAARHGFGWWGPTGPADGVTGSGSSGVHSFPSRSPTMLSPNCLHELRSSWLPNITDAGLDRLIDLLEKG